MRWYDALKNLSYSKILNIWLIGRKPTRYSFMALWWRIFSGLGLKVRSHNSLSVIELSLLIQQSSYRQSGGIEQRISRMLYIASTWRDRLCRAEKRATAAPSEYNTVDQKKCPPYLHQNVTELNISDLINLAETRWSRRGSWVSFQR
jgi:hypothetical protein